MERALLTLTSSEAKRLVGKGMRREECTQGWIGGPRYDWRY
jgi:hypothetical protein